MKPIMEYTLAAIEAFVIGTIVIGMCLWALARSFNSLKQFLTKK